MRCSFALYFSHRYSKEQIVWKGMVIMKKVENCTQKDLEYQKKLREYMIKAVFYEVSKIFIFLFVFMYLNLTVEYFVALFALMLLRNHGGGLHFQHYMSCLLVSFLFLYASIRFALLWQPDRILMGFCTLVCAPAGFFLVPVTSSNRPAATEQQRKHSKRCTLFIILSFFLVICICPLHPYLYIGFWTLILHIFQLLIAHMKGGLHRVLLDNQI